jgi:A/G-specific adenine glycosylase
MVSEVMLQQTSVGRVLPKYEPFVEAFPTPQFLADAPLGRALELWQGLGYPRRCRNLRDAASVIVHEHGNVVPYSLSELMALPGIGSYTARAILAFAFKQDVAVVDVNVSRVLSRLHGAPLKSRELQSLADSLVPEGLSWDWNQVIMEFGGRVCSARSPQCNSCPLQQWCVFGSQSDSHRNVDPARLSAGVSKPQPTFKGSDRQIRGRILKNVLGQEHDVDLLVADMGVEFDVDRVRNLVTALVAEGLLRQKGNMVSAP